MTLYLAVWWPPKPIFASSPRGLERRSAKRFHIALGVADLESSAHDYSQRLGCRPDLLVSEKYALWRKDTVNLSIRKLAYKEGGARRGYGSGDVVRSGGAIHQRLLGWSPRQIQLAGLMRVQIDLLQGMELIRQFRDPLIASTNQSLKSVYR